MYKKGKSFYKVNALDELPHGSEFETKIRIKKAGRGHSAEKMSTCSSKGDNRTIPDRKLSYNPILPIDDLLNLVVEKAKIDANVLNDVCQGGAADLRS